MSDEEREKPNLDDEMLRLAANSIVIKLDILAEEEKHIHNIKDVDLKYALQDALSKYKWHLKALHGQAQDRLKAVRDEKYRQEREKYEQQKIENAEKILKEAGRNVR